MGLRFKAGDKVRFVVSVDEFTKGQEVIISDINIHGGYDYRVDLIDGSDYGYAEDETLELVPTVNAVRPEHYKVGGIEPIDYMQVKLSKEAFAGFCAGNVIKYVSRYEHKNGTEDLQKAEFYLKKLIEIKGE